MKKTYIEPKNTIVALNVRDNVMQVGSAPDFYPDQETINTSGNLSREVIIDESTISSRDAWEEW